MTTSGSSASSRRLRAGLGTRPVGKRTGARRRSGAVVGGAERAERVAAARIPEHPVEHTVVVPGLDLRAHMLGAVSRCAEREILVPGNDSGSVGNARAPSLRIA